MISPLLCIRFCAVRRKTECTKEFEFLLLFTQGGGLAALPWASCVPSFQDYG